MSSMLAVATAVILILSTAFTSSSAFVQPSLASPAAWPASAVPIARVLSFVARQYSHVYHQWLDDPTAYPNYGEPSESKWRTLSSTGGSFTNGFFPGRFLYLVRLALSRTLPRSLRPMTSTSSAITLH